MIIEVSIVNSPLSLEPVVVEGCGAVARFDGIVRGMENGEPIAALEYEAYDSMARKSITQILEDLHQEHPFELVRVLHRVGIVPVGEAAILMDVHTTHRVEAFALLASFMDRLKKDVPIWKVHAVKGEAKGARTSIPGTTKPADGTSALP